MGEEVGSLTEIFKSPAFARLAAGGFLVCLTVAGLLELAAPPRRIGVFVGAGVALWIIGLLVYLLAKWGERLVRIREEGIRCADGSRRSYYRYDEIDDFQIMEGEDTPRLQIQTAEGQTIGVEIDPSIRVSNVQSLLEEKLRKPAGEIREHRANPMLKWITAGLAAFPVVGSIYSAVRGHRSIEEGLLIASAILAAATLILVLLSRLEVALRPDHMRVRWWLETYEIPYEDVVEIDFRRSDLLGFNSYVGLDAPTHRKSDFRLSRLSEPFVLGREIARRAMEAGGVRIEGEEEYEWSIGDLRG